MGSAKNLNLTPENVLRMRKYLGENESKLEQKYYETLEPIAGFIAPFVKETLVYGGVINPGPQHRYQESQYIFDFYSDYKEKIATFAKRMKLPL